MTDSEVLHFSTQLIPSFKFHVRVKETKTRVQRTLRRPSKDFFKGVESEFSCYKLRISRLEDILSIPVQEDDKADSSRTGFPRSLSSM